MTDAEEDLVVAEKATTSTKPTMLTALTVAGIVIAAFKLTSIAASLPFLLNPHAMQGNAAANVPEQLVEYQRLMVDVQAKFQPYQFVLLPISALVAGYLLWGAIKGLKLRPRGDVWLCLAVIASAAIDAIGAVLVLLMQMETYVILRQVFETVEVDPDDAAAQIMGAAMYAGFYLGAARAVGFLLLQFGYYVVTFRYFSRPEISALYQD